MAKPIESSHTTSNDENDNVEPSNSIGVGVIAGQGEVDNIQAVETMIKNFLSGGLEILNFPAEVTKIREACEFLTSPQLIGTMPNQRKEAIYSLKSELDNLIYRLYKASTVIDKDNELRSRQALCQSAVTQKIKELDLIEGNKRLTLEELNEAKETLSVLERQMAGLKITISNVESRLQTLYSRVKELGIEIRDLKVTDELAAQERNGLSLQLHMAKKHQRYAEERWKSIQSLFGVEE